MRLLKNFLLQGFAALYFQALALSQKVGFPVADFDKVIRSGTMD